MAVPNTSVFRKLLRRAIFINDQETELFDKIPDAVLDGIFKHNFNGNLALAERILLNRHGEVDRVDRARLEQGKLGIRGLDKAAGKIIDALAAGRAVLFVTDNDNDGSLAQAILMEFVKTLPVATRNLIHVEYSQPIGVSRGISREIVDLSFEARSWDKDEEVLIVTADNGINSQMEVERIHAAYPKSDIIITDHHLPRDDLVVQENPRAMIFNPKYKPTEYFKTKNISGANTLGVLLKTIFERMSADPVTGVDDSADNRLAVANMGEIGSWANLLDYANSDIADMPIRPYIVEKALKLRPLLNVSNSMSTLVSGKFSKQDFEEIALASQGTGLGKTLTAEWLAEKIEAVRMINVISRKLLNVYHKFGSQQNTYSDKDFYRVLSEELANPGDHYSSINPNYIEQLRPIIFNVAAIDNKDLFLAMLAQTMTETMGDLRKVERDILEGLRGVGLLKSDKRPNSTILYPIDDSVMRVFNRRLLGKAYNEDNNGFLLILSDISGNEAKGSMRSMYPISKLLEDKSEIEDQLGISVDFQGHETAAGFFIRTQDGSSLSSQALSDFNRWMDDRVGEMKIAEKINQMPTLEVDFASAGLVEKINRAVKANLAGMWGLPTIMRFSPDKKLGVYITDDKTTEQISLSELIERKRFGYQAIKTDFHDGAVVAPIELLRSVVDSGYTKALRLSYMDEGVFMGSQVVDPEQLPNLVNLKGGRSDQRALASYYARTYKDSHFIPLDRKDFQSSPYFRFNKYGEGEFELFESLVIEMLDEAQADVLSVIDTEGTGLGKAPKCFNIGGTNIMIAPKSGTSMDSAEFEDRYFRNATSNEFLLTPEQMSTLTRLDDAEDAPAGSLVLHRISLDQGVSYQDRFAFPGKTSDMLRLTNVKLDEDKVLFNRTIEGVAYSFLVNNKDFAITQELENLTGIANWMVEELGIPATNVDRQLVHFYENLKNPEGGQAKVIFQAHNMPYDRGIVLANFQKLNKLMGEHLTSDTAKIARSARLAYDDTPVSSFEGVVGIPRAYFYDSPYSNYSMSTFLARCQRGKGGVFPDTKAKVLLRYNPETERFSIIDRRENYEILIDATVADLIEKKKVGQMPNTELKYSVERLSSRAMIRNVLLLDKPVPQKVALLENEVPFRAALELFQEKYHFDITPKRNIEHFQQSLFGNEKNQKLLSEVDLSDLAGRFIAQNAALQAKFHDGWIYEKVLGIHEPDATTLRVPAEVVEEVNYFTDLPSSKIRKVFDDVINFKRHFKVESALVHEQHNNIRQRSDDGQGLSDTAYESVLPQFLAMMKFFNPYYQSVKKAAKALVTTNIRGSMIQTMMGDDFTNELASDSFSMSQMMAFKRKGQTDLVRRAQNIVKKGEVINGELAPIRFKLGTDVLPDGTGVYAKPLAHVSREQVMLDSKKLSFILVNEQIKNAATANGGAHGERMAEMAAGNDALAITYRDDLLTRYERVDFSRRDTHLKTMQKLIHDTFDGNDKAKLPKVIDFTDEMLASCTEMVDGFRYIYKNTGQDFEYSTVDKLVEMMKAKNEEYTELMGLQDPKSFEPEGLRQANFLPDLTIKRQEPLKFALEHMGVTFCAPFMKTLVEPDSEVVEAVTTRRGRSP
jgi:single-stranded DNA-specific DHH superfamily exonuclease